MRHIKSTGIAVLMGLALLVSMMYGGDVSGQPPGGANNLAVRVAALEAQVAALQSELAAAQSGLDLAMDLVQCLSVDTNNINGLAGPHVIFEGCNVHVQNGLNDTESADGRGNLVIGYNEDDETIVTDREGSHNLIVGPNHSYGSYGGLVAGYSNAIDGTFASVSGGSFNTASGNRASVSGGSGNVASSLGASINGGLGNTASASNTSVCGGAMNDASGESASVSGGFDNTASGNHSSVSGGAGRSAEMEFDWAAGSLYENE